VGVVGATFPLGGQREGGARYLRALLKRWLFIVLFVAVAAAGAAVFAHSATKQYQAEADVLVTPFNDPSDAFAGISLLRDSSSSVYAAGLIVTTPKVTTAVIDRLHLSVGRTQLLDWVTVKPLQQSNIVAIQAKVGSAAGAAAIANAFATVLVEQRSEAFQQELKAAIQRVRERLARSTPKSGEALALEDQLATLTALLGAPDPTVEIFSRAVPPEKAVWPRPVLSVVLAFFAALLLGIVFVLVLELLDPRILDEDELADVVPVVAWIPRAPRRVVHKYLHGNRLLPADLWEAYRTLRASITGEGADYGGSRTVLVTSAIQGEGKTMTSVNLAIAIAAAGERVVLVDGDLRRPTVASVFSIDPTSAGLASVLLGKARADEVLIPTQGFGDRLQLVVAGSGSPVDLLDPKRIQGVLQDLTHHADVIILDSPPLTEFADAFALAESVDVVLIAVRLGRSRRDRFTDLRRFLAQHGLAAAGFVVTSRRRSRGPRTALGTEGEFPASPAWAVISPWLEAGAKSKG
jgi:capsular exopolysaccharide synthesis family protein